jgi:DNA-binding FadR family transcriptional regulator
MGIASRRRTGRVRAVREQTVIDHREIAAAIAARDAHAASSAMLRHLDNVERAVTG